jgi:2,5-diamino-6-(ribosylamino)-4(3H)-pyrimidinone 5'-phosphate reductase
MAPSREALTFPSSKAILIDPYLPSTTVGNTSSSSKPFVTLTYATSLDSSLALSPGVQTALSGPQSKAMTHYLRSKHDAILIGCGTAIADNPSLNCRIEGVGGYGGDGLESQPRPVVLDPQRRWEVDDESKVIKLARDGAGKAPWIFVLSKDENEVQRRRRMVLEKSGGRVIPIGSTTETGRMDWNTIFALLAYEGIRSIMIEGGGVVINDLLLPRWLHLVDSVIITMAPIWLGKGGVTVCPSERRNEQGERTPVGSLKEVHWMPLGEDVVLCGRPNT